MKGNKRIITKLNALLAEELTAINQYIVHSEMCANWGYDALHGAIEKQAIDEMKHAEKLIARILFLDGTPIVTKLNPIHIGATVADMVTNDLQGEVGAVASYNAGIKLAVEVGDDGTRDLFTAILKDEERHVDWEEEQRDQIEHMGLALYLTTQTG
jgi:bacterioferritin